jgi:addiction module HigA family antidote
MSGTDKKGGMLSKMHNPTHPGLKLLEDVLPALDLNVMKASEQLGIPRAAFSKVIHGQAGVLPKMALRLEAWLSESHAGSANTWLSL